MDHGPSADPTRLAFVFAQSTATEGLCASSILSESPKERIVLLHQQTLQTLRMLRLTAMADAYVRQTQDPEIATLTFDERLGLLVDQEWTHRQDRLLNRLLREARLKLPACPEDIDYQASRGLEGSTVRQLAMGQWLQAHHNLLIVGPTGVGKTFLACALGNAACRQGYRTRYYRLSRLLGDIQIAKGDGSYRRLLNQVAKVDLLILDDWGLAPLSGTESREILEVLDDRILHSTCVVSQLPLHLWHQHFADSTVADAVLDRLIYTSHKI